MDETDLNPELDDDQTGLLLANMRADGKVQRARRLKPEHAYPMPSARITPIEVQRARFYAGVIDGTETNNDRTRKRHRSAADWINRPTFQRMIQQAMGAAGVTPERIAAKVSGLMDAEDHRGHADHETQLRATRLAHDMLMDSTEHAPPEREELADLASDLAELTIDELQRRAVLLNQGSADARAGNPAGRRRRSR